ncbi:EAL domain-containing protein [Comamonas sp. NLF-1-9]|uniref:bifunctional diguanylate cyclase/phosphodiesterase n=1 Tax=Comamonas sp. NLF-1-9 TaxID=2853163 RepID=UPI001C440707|nr:EAL domain-containing protein [Comamonas sp. NLF-1-9]QXL84491.1 EAL domain-containing protein [Comamonas sp. NLF-1-9]
MGHWLAGAGVLLAGLLLAWTLAHRQQLANERMAAERFGQAVTATTEALSRRLEACSAIVAGVRDLFAVDPDLDWRRFDRVLQARGFRAHYPELRTLSFTRVVAAQDLPAMEERLRAQARQAGQPPPEEPIHPKLQAREHFIIEYLWPRDLSLGMWGLDINARPTSLQALLSARETGMPVLSGPLQLSEMPYEREAFTLRYPVFGTAPGVADGAPAFIGTVAATVRVSEMLDALRYSGVLRGIALRLRDAGSTAAPLAPGAAVFLGETADMQERWNSSPLRQQASLQMLGRRWELTYVPTQPLLSASEAVLPQWVGAAGAAAALWLALGVALLLRQRAQALQRAERAEDLRRSSEHRLSAMFSQTAVGVATIDVQTLKFERVNRKFCEILGYTPQEILQLDVHAVSDSRDAEANDRLRRQLRNGEISAFHLERRMRRKDGSFVWTDLTVSPVVRDGGAPLYNIGVVQDITERRAMRDELAASEQRLRAILDHLPVGIAMWQRGKGMVYRNRHFAEVTGYTRERLSTSAQWWQMAYPEPAARERAQTLWKTRCERAETRDGVIEWGEYEVCCADGQTKPLGISGVMFKDAQLVIVEDLSGRKAAQDEINFLACYDALTGLANRRLLLERMKHVLAASAASGRSGALLMLDLDHFKTLNETRGHARGDALLRQVATRLRNCLGEQDMLARHGDDEFVIVLVGAHDTRDLAAVHARALAERVLSALRAPFMLDGGHYHTTASVGAVVFQGEGEPADALLQQVDMAMYQAKEAGRDAVRFYDPQIQSRVQARASLERDLRHALERGQFELHYQAQVQGGRITGAEALLRWHHPVQGYVAPTQFIALAEQTGLIVGIGDWVLRSACAQLALWAGEPALAPLTLAVNISPRQFSQSDFAAQVLAALAGSGANARRLELELTEGLLLQDVEDTIAKMMQLKAYGVDFSLDDFGTGYSSLSYLKRLPLDQLKIDQSFVRDVLLDPNDAAIARTIVALGHSLGLRVIAEGVETVAQRDFLRQHGCEAWQGYLFSKPLPLAQFEALVRAGAPLS